MSELEVKARAVEAALCIHAFWSFDGTTWCNTRERAGSPSVTSLHPDVTCPACRQALINAGLLPGEMWV